MRNYEKKVEGLEKRAGLEEDKNVVEELPGNMFQIRNNKRNAVVVLPHKLTPEEWNRKFAPPDKEDKEKPCIGIF